MIENMSEDLFEKFNRLELRKQYIRKHFDHFRIILDPYAVYHTPNNDYLCSLSKVGLPRYAATLSGRIIDLYRLEDRAPKEYCKDKSHIYTWTNILYYLDGSGNWEHCYRRISFILGECFWMLPDSIINRSPYATIIHVHKKFHSIDIKSIRCCSFIRDYLDRYYITNTGDIWSVQPNEIRLLHPTKDEFGYLCINLQKPNPIKSLRADHYRIHRLVALAFCPIPQYLLDKNLTFDDLVVNHIDGNPANNHYTNLEWVTQFENLKHAQEVLYPNDSDWLTYEEYCHVKDLIHDTDLSNNQIAAKCNLNSHTVGYVRNLSQRVLYRHLHERYLNEYCNNKINE